MSVDANSIIDSLKWRYATKQFDPNKKISEIQWQILEEALRLSPSSFGLQPYRFVIVTDKKTKSDLQPVCWNQAQVSDCSHFVIIARLNEVSLKTVDDYINLIAETRNVSVASLKNLHGMMNGFVTAHTDCELNDWAARQAYIALGNLMTAASAIQIDNCPMEGINCAEVDRILKLNEKGCSSLVACALGYRASADKNASLAKVRFPAEKLFIKI